MPFEEGKSGNPKGRPKGVGTRETINRAFLLKLQDHFFKFGESALNRMCYEDPSSYIKVVASLLPKEFKIDGTIEVGSEPVSDLNRWLTDITSEHIKRKNQNALQGGSILPPPLCLEQERRSEPLDISEVQGSSTKPKWLS